MGQLNVETGLHGQCHLQVNKFNGTELCMNNGIKDIFHTIPVW